MKNLVITALVFLACILVFTACSSTRQGRSIIVSKPMSNEELRKPDVKEVRALGSTDNGVALGESTIGNN